MDDVQIGGGSGAQMGQTSAAEADNTGPLEKRLVSKNWSVRANAFEELTNICKDPSNTSNKPIFAEYAGEFKTYLKDSNPGALEKALISLEAFLMKVKGTVMVEHQNDLLNIITDKCLGHAKPTIKTKANECIMLMFDCTEAFTEAQEALLGLAANKNIKIMTCGTQLIASLLDVYGLKKIQFNVYNEQMIKNAQNTNPACKQAAYDFYKALYKWKGDSIIVLLEDKLKKQQVDDLKKIFEEVKTQWEGKKKEVRQTKKEATEAETRKKDDAIEQSLKQEEEVVDKLEFAPIINVLEKYGVEWQDSTTALTKWQDKVEKLTELAKDADGKKIKPGNYEGMCMFLKKEIGAVNINVALSAVKVSTVLASGMRKDFGPYIKSLMGVTLSKYKEKGQRVTEELQKFFDASLECTNLEEIKDEVFPQITNVAPTVKTGTIKYIEKIALTTYIDVLQKVENDLLPSMVKALDDKDAGVRETALHCMGILKGRYSEATIGKYLKDVIPQKMAKIDEAAKEIKPSKYDRPENWKPPVPKKVAPKKEEKLDDDDLMNADVAPPKKAPPKGIGQKPPSKKKPAEDVEMKEEAEVKQAVTVPELPKKGPPASLGQKPAGASDRPKTTVPTKAPTGPKVQEEDLGAGISKEDALDKCNQFYNPATIKAFEEAKWQDKVEGFLKLQEEIKEKQPNAQMMEATSRFIKTMMKDWKESNINLQKGIVATYLVMARDCDTMSKRSIKTGMEFLVDKLGDVKMLAQTKELLMFASEVVTPRYIALQVVKYAAAAKAPNVQKEASTQLAEMLDEFGPAGWPLQETIDFGKVAVNHATPAVRQAAMKLFSIIYQHAGEAIRNFLTEIKDSTLKLIEAEFAKITPFKRGEYEKKRSCRGEAAAEEEAMMGAAAKKGKGGGGGGAVDLLAALPRQDISKQITTKLLEQFKNKDWKIRVKGGEDIEVILRDAKMRIEVNGLNELMDALKNGMKDSNKAVVKKYIQLLGVMAEAIGPAVKTFIKKCFIPMLNNLSDKQSLVRADVIASIDKWAEQIGPEQVITQIGAAIALENPEMRSEGIKWILDHQDSIKDADCVSIVKPLVSCLTDKVKDIRDKTDQICIILMPISGYSEFQDAIKDFKPAVQQTLKPIIEKIKNSCGAGASGGAPVQAPKVEDKQSKTVPDKKETVVAQPPGSFQKAAAAKKDEKKLEPEVSQEQLKKAQINVPKGKGGDEENEYNIVGTANAKAKRALNDSRTKFPVGEVKGDHIEVLQTQCTQIFGQKFSDLMFAKAVDFNKHIGCVKQLEKFITTHPSELIEVLDIIFKWGSLRMTESSNTQLLMSIFDFYTALLLFLTENQTKLQEFEALVLIGSISEKCGHNIKTMADKARKLLKQCYDVYEPKQLYRILVDNGTKNKNLKVVSESLDEISDYITANGVDSVTKKDFTVFLQAVDSADKGVRESSLKVYAEIYQLIGEDVWRLQPKDIPLKVKGLLEQRFKQVTKKTGGLSASINNLNMASTLKGKTSDTLSATQNSSAKNSRQSVMLPQAAGLKFNKPGAILNDNCIEEKQKAPQVNKKEDVEMAEDEPEVPDDKQENNISITNKIEKMQINDREHQKRPMPNEEDDRQIFEKKNKIENSPPQKDQAMDQPNDEQSASPIQKKKQIPKLDLPMKEDDEAIEITKSVKKDFRLSVNLDEVLNQAEDKLIIDPELAKHRQTILTHIEALKVGDMMKRINCLIALNDIISATGEAQSEQEQPQSVNQSPESQMLLKAMIRCCDQLIQAYTEVMIDLFNIPITEIPLRFTKYFITIVNKTCCAKNIMREVSQKQVLGLVEQLLTRLLIENLDKIGKEKEGELIMKNLNASMLRMLENCNHTHIFVVLFSLLIKYKDDASQPKVVSLIIKCLLKLSKNMEKLIDKVNLSKLLVAIHEYLCSMPTEKRTQNDDLGTRIAKTLINDIVRLKPSEIWRHYESVKNHHQPDKHVEKWIQIVLKGLPANAETSRGTEQSSRNQGYGGDSSTQQVPQENKSKMYQEFEMKKILQDLKKGIQSDYEQGIQRLDKFVKANPLYDYQKALNKEGDAFSTQVNVDLNKFRNGNSRISTNNTDSLGGRGDLNTSNTKNTFSSKRMSNVASSSQLIGLQSSQNELNKSLKQNAFQSKLAQLNSRNSNVNPAQTMQNNGQTQAQIQQNLNSSFSELNANLANKWAQINNSNSKKFGGATGRPMTAQNGGPLVNTMRASVGVGGAGPIGGNLLNTSNNQFKSRLGGGFANRVQTKQGENNSSLGGVQQQVDNVNTSIGNSSQNNSQQINISGQNTSQNAGGISSNSFRTRLIGLKQTRQTETNEPSESLTMSGGMSSGVGVSGSSATLQKKLADMKAKLSSVKKQ